MNPLLADTAPDAVILPVTSNPSGNSTLPSMYEAVDAYEADSMLPNHTEAVCAYEDETNPVRSLPSPANTDPENDPVNGAVEEVN